MKHHHSKKEILPVTGERLYKVMDNLCDGYINVIEDYTYIEWFHMAFHGRVVLADLPHRLEVHGRIPDLHMDDAVAAEALHWLGLINFRSEWCNAYITREEETADHEYVVEFHIAMTLDPGQSVEQLSGMVRSMLSSVEEVSDLFTDLLAGNRAKLEEHLEYFHSKERSPHEL